MQLNYSFVIRCEVQGERWGQALADNKLNSGVRDIPVKATRWLNAL